MSYIKRAWAWLTGVVSRITTRYPFVKRKRFYIPVALIIIGLIAYAAFSKPAEPQFETQMVERQDVVRIVNETGTVEPAAEVDLFFTGSGRIDRVYVTEGQTVRAGQLIATLEGTQQYASLQAARARLAQAQAQARSSGLTREQLEAQQDQLVENARRELVSGDLQAYLVSGASEGDIRDFSPPTISGTYRCDREGTYRLETYASTAPSGGSFRFSGLESGTGTGSTVAPMALGSCGLYIQFPENFARGRNIVWEIPVPNVRSATYQSRRNMYEAALENRRLALQESERSPILAAQVEEARAAVLAAEAAFADTQLVAPFTGLVTNVDAVRGDIASMGSPAASLISTNAFEIKLLIPEDDIGYLDVGDEAEVTFDAYEDVRLPARVSFISPRATNETGSASFWVTLQFTEQDERIRAGLSVDVDIRAAEATDVIAVPVRAVIEEDGERYVRVLDGPTSWRRVPVTVGLRGGGLVEITGGLEGGEHIITFANNAALNVLTEVESDERTPEDENRSSGIRFRSR